MNGKLGDVVREVFGCSACGKNHARMKFHERDPLNPDRDEWTHSGFCPDTGIEVLLRFEGGDRGPMRKATEEKGAE